MNAVVIAHSACATCGKPFAFNPLRVPSWRSGPICPVCIDLVNARRKEIGLPAFEIAPDAYEPLDAKELSE